MKENKDYAQRMMEHYVNNPPPSEAEGIIEALKEEVESKGIWEQLKETSAMKKATITVIQLII